MSSEAVSGQTGSVLDTSPSNPAGWSETYAGMAWFNAAFADIDERHRYDGKNFLAALRGAGKKISIELGAIYLDNFCDAARRNDPAFFYDASFQKPRLAEYGDSLEGSQLQNSPVFGQVDYVIIDDPFLRAYDRQSFPYSAACASQPFAFDFAFFQSEVVKYMQLIKARLPHVKFVLSTSTAHWNYTSPAATYYPSLTGHGDSINLPGGANLNFKALLDSLIPAAAAGGVPFDGMIVDYPYNYVTQAISGQVPNGTLLSPGSAEYANRWGRLTGLVTDAHSRGLKAYLFVNSEQVPATVQDEVRSSQKFHDETTSYIADIISKGVPLDMALVESWFYNFGTGGTPTAPRALLPETDPYTSTNTARDVLRQIQAYNEPVFGVTGKVLGPGVAAP